MKKWLIGLACAGLFATAAMGQLVISQYTETESGTTPKGVEIWNSSASDITFDAGSNLLDVKIGVNGAAPASAITVNSGTLIAGDVLVIGTEGMTPDIVKAFTFNGDDAIVLELGGVVQDMFGTAEVDPGTAWSGNGVSTANQNIQLKSGITTGDTDGWTDPSERFELVSATPSTDLTGFGVAPGGSAAFSVNLDKQNGFTVEQGASGTIIATAQNGTEPYGYTWDTTMAVGDYNASGDTFTILDTAATGDFSATVTATDDASETAEKTVTFSVVVPAVKYGIAITPPVNGTVTTTPADEAEAGQTVTINANGNSGYAVDTITVVDADMGAVAVTLPARTFTMPAKAVTVTVTFVEASASGELIISQYYEGTSNNKWIEIYNPGATTIDLAAAGYRLGQFSNSNRELWKTDGTPSLTVVLSNTIAAGGTYLVSHTSATNPIYAVAGQKAGLVHNGDDSVVLYTGETYAFANVVDAFGLLGNTAANKSFVRKDTITVGVNTDFNAAEWDEFTNIQVDEAAESTNERLGYHSTGPATFGVSLSQNDGYEVEQGTSGTIIATAQNGTEPYGYTWDTTMAVGDYNASGDTFTILATAALGDFSATVTATDDASATAEKTVTFSVVTPAVKYGITITAPVNGTVTTTPATEAEAGQVVTINATPDANYAVGTIEVLDAALNPVAVSGTPPYTFTMPASAVTVTVPFEEVVAEGIVDFRFNTEPYLQATAKDANLTVTDMALTAGTIETAITTGTYFTDEPYVEETGGWTATSQAEAKAFVFTITPAEGSSITIDGISFNAYATAAGPSAFGFDIGGGTSSFEVNAPSAVLLSVSQAVVGVENATGAIEVKIQGWLNGSRESTGSGVFRLDDVVIHGTVYSGPPVFSVSLDKSNGFTVNEGSTATIVATAANGEAPYTWEWTTDLPVGTYNAPGGAEPGGKSFFIQNNAPTGTYYATATATDNTSATAQKTVTFSVVGLPVGEPAVIISGNLSGTVGVQMNLAISITNETATDWFIDLVDPDALADTTYGFDGSTFTLTPTKTGTYVLTITAVTETGNVSNTVNLVISGGGGELPNITEFEVPAGATASATLATTTVGKTYKLQYTTNLLAVPVVWQDADTQAGTGGEITLQDGDPADMARYYRVTEN